MSTIHKIIRTSFFSVLLRITGILTLYSCNQGLVEQKEVGFDASRYLNHASGVAYVGMQPCKSCHPDQFNSFTHTEMGRSMKTAALENSIANWHRQNPVFDASTNLYYLPFSKKDSLYLLEYRLAEGGDTLFSRVEKIDLIVGSGQHTNSHFILQNGYVYQAPLTWYAQKGEWHLPPGFENGGNTRFSRIIGQECMTCHNGFASYVQGSKNKFDKIPEGIDCERCHGPGEKHVQEKMAGNLVDVASEVDYTIVNPGKLSADLQMDACQRCHLQGISVLKEGKTHYDFIPGMSLNSVYEVYQARFKDSESSFIMASHSDRLQRSNCYVQSRTDDPQDGLTCITCHDPHVSVTKVGSGYFNGKCIECHNTKQCSETEVRRKENDNSCVVCHMKKASSYDIPHVHITDHYIVKRPVSREVEKAALAQSEQDKQKDFVRLFCRTNTNPEPLSTAKAYLNYFEKYAKNPALLDSALSYLNRAKMSEAAGNKHWIRYYFLRENYKAVVAYSKKTMNMDGWTAYRIGQSYFNLEQVPLAIPFYEKAVELEPFDLDFNNKWAAALIKNKQFASAREVLEKTLKLNPDFAETNNNLGFCLVSLSFEKQAEMKEALPYFEKALALNPDYIKAMENLASLYLNLGEKRNATRIINQLLQVDSQNPTYQKFDKVVKLL